MRDTNLKSPGILSNGYLLRRTASAAISTIEIAARKTVGGQTVGATKLRAFFLDCAEKLEQYDSTSGT